MWINLNDEVKGLIVGMEEFISNMKQSQGQSRIPFTGSTPSYIVIKGD